MFIRRSDFLRGAAFLLCAFLAPVCASARQQRTNPFPSSTPDDKTAATTVSLIVMVRDESGGPLDMALASLNSSHGGVLAQATTIAGRAEFDNMVPGDYTLDVIAAGYETYHQTMSVNGQATFASIILKPVGSSDSSAAGKVPGMPVLAPKAQKLMAKVLELLRAKNPEEARPALDQLLHMAPAHPDVHYLYGVYCLEIKDLPGAYSHWQKALNLYPNHYGSLIFLGETMLTEEKPDEALTYLKRAAEVAPTAWRPHALMAQADQMLGKEHFDDAVREAEHAMELGHSQAAAVAPVLANLLAAQEKKERAIALLQQYLQEHSQDAAARKLLEALRNPPAPAPTASPAALSKKAPPAPAAAPFISPAVLPSAWMPPDVDERVPEVVPGVPCKLNDVLQRVGQRMTELVLNVDRFSATEQLTHKRIDSGGQPAPPEKRTFNYVVTIAEPRPGILDVQEFRGPSAGISDFPDDIATLGLPSMVLVFHPAFQSSFEYTCEGLMKSDTQVAWLVHFRQKFDSKTTLLAYRSNTKRMAIGVKGRAWITPDSFQVARLESDLISPHPEIHLGGLHTEISYTAVRFQSRDVRMWLPEFADVYMDWDGKRIYRRHSFSNFILFSVDDKQKITPPPDATASPPAQ